MTRALLCVALLGLLAGCADTDPLQRQGLWRPNHANETDLRAMVADPADLVAGRGDPAGDGPAAVAAIERLRSDTVKPMRTYSLSIGQDSGGSGGGGGAGAGSSGGN